MGNVTPGGAVHPPVGFRDELSNERWSDEEFLSYRERVLARWETGIEIADLDECVGYTRSLPAERNLALRLREARTEGVPLLEIGIGHTTDTEQREHMAAAVGCGVDMILVLTDTYTRKSTYDRAQAGLQRALAGPETRVLNGFPIVNYGLRARELFAANGVPMHITGNVDEEAMLSSEFGFACGATCDWNHSLHDLVQHSRDYPLKRRIQTNQYASRLAAYYTDHGAPIEAVVLANYQGLVPPGLGIAVAVLSALSAAGQGVKYMSLQRCIEGSFAQDVAAFHAYRRVAADYLNRFGFDDVDCVTYSWPWMGAWPEPEFENAGLVAWCSAISMLAGVDWLYLKSIHEGSGIPNTASNLASIEITHALRRIIPRQAVAESAEIAEEAALIEEEARSLLDAVLDLGDGDPCLGLVVAVEHGYIDIPMASWKGVADRVIAVRDCAGAVRYLDPGALPLTDRVKQHHARSVARRRELSSLESDIALVIHDIRQYMTD
jgi:methylaspartate mutase epsilon subunit